MQYTTDGGARSSGDRPREHRRVAGRSERRSGAGPVDAAAEGSSEAASSKLDSSRSKVIGRENRPEIGGKEGGGGSP